MNDNIARDLSRMAVDGTAVHQDGDYSVTALAFGGAVRAFACRSTVTVETARGFHDLSPLVTAALGRLLSAAALLALDLKGDFSDTSLSVRGDGPIQGLFAIANTNGDVRGYAFEAHAEVENLRPGKLNVGAGVGKGSLTVIKNNNSDSPYTSQVELLSGEIAQDVNYYLALSEQIPSVVALGVLVDKNGVRAAGGLVVELMPGADEKLIDYLEQRAAGFPDTSSLLDEGFDPAELIDLFLGDPELEYLATKPLRYACNCSRERMADNLRTLGDADLQQLAADPEGIDVQCHFCDQRYHFASTEIRDIRAKSSPQSSPHPNEKA